MLACCSAFAAAALAGPAAAEEGSVLQIELPGKGEVALSETVESSRSMSFPLVANGQSGNITIPIITVTNFEGIFGYLAQTSSGVYGTIVDEQTDGSRRYFEVTPALPGAKMKAVEVRADGLAEKCGAELLALSGGQKETGEKGAPSPSLIRREVQLAAVSPSDFTAGRTEADVAAQTAATIAGANIYFERLGLVLKLVGLEVFADSKYDPYADAELAQDAFAMLETASREWQSRQSIERDLVVVFGRGKYNGYLGLAYPSTSCLHPEFGYLFAAQGLQTALGEKSLSSTLAHEIGHVIGMSHDETFYTNGQSVMWPYYATNPFGFSDYSISQYEQYAGAGQPGGACFSSLPDPLQPDERVDSARPRFADGTQKSFVVQEGQTLTYRFRISAGGSVLFTAKGLPAGATVDPVSGEFSYSPSYDAVPANRRTRSFSPRITATSTSGTTRIQIRIRVEDVNRSPEFALTAADQLTIRAGEPLSFSLAAQDPDVGDRLTFSLGNRSTVRRYPGRPRIRSNRSAISLNWTPPLGTSGQYDFLFTARDRKGAVVSRLISVFVN